MPELVVDLAFLGVGEDLVGLGGFLELALGFGVVGVGWYFIAGRR
ncbi:MAG: hypothetical protein R3B49_03975 [Phycisphaerales bacterium]